MFTSSKVSFLISALLAGAAFTQTASATALSDQPIAREAGEARGEGKGHPAIEVKDLLAREAGEARGEGKGHPAIEVKDLLAREAGEARGEGKGHPAIEVVEQLA